MNAAARFPIRSFSALSPRAFIKREGRPRLSQRPGTIRGTPLIAEQRVSNAPSLTGVCLQFWRQSPKTLWMVFDMAINPGDMAPDFTLTSHLGSPVTLSDLRGAPVVLAFHPASFTGG